MVELLAAGTRAPERHVCTRGPIRSTPLVLIDVVKDAGLVAAHICAATHHWP